MSDKFRTDDKSTETSPWPVFVAFGITLSEIGILFGIHLLSVGGLLLFVGTVAGIFRESGYMVRPERAVGIQGVALIGIGLALIAANHIGSTVRGQSLTIAGMISLIIIPIWLAYIQR